MQEIKSQFPDSEREWFRLAVYRPESLILLVFHRAIT